MQRRGAAACRQQDLVSVVMPVYDAAAWVEEAVASILAQTHRNLELIAVDDGSRDTSLAILERLARSDARMRVLACPHRGVIPARNEGLRHAHGKLVACMDADDFSLPHRLERQVAALGATRLVCVGGGRGATRRASDQPLTPPQGHDAISDGPDRSLAHLRSNGPSARARARSAATTRRALRRGLDLCCGSRRGGLANF